VQVTARPKLRLAKQLFRKVAPLSSSMRDHAGPEIVADGAANNGKPRSSLRASGKGISFDGQGTNMRKKRAASLRHISRQSLTQGYALQSRKLSKARNPQHHVVLMGMTVP